MVVLYCTRSRNNNRILAFAVCWTHWQCQWLGNSCSASYCLAVQSPKAPLFEHMSA